MLKNNNQNNNCQQQFKTERPWFLFLALLVLIGAALLIVSSLQTTSSSLLYCGGGGGRGALSRRSLPASSNNETSSVILHYATSRVVPQQSFQEITVSLDVLNSIGPCNFLVFGLGHDSLMWASFNLGGKTIFLEEDPKWIEMVLKDAPALRAQPVAYRTQLSESSQLLQHYGSQPDCSIKKSFLRANHNCRLSLHNLSDEVYDTEWDMIMIDAPRGYFPEAPGRMAAIYSAAIMARNRKKSGVTHIFLHDVNRPVEQMYAKKFLCMKYLVKAEGRLWHFEIPPSTNINGDFCDNTHSTS